MAAETRIIPAARARAEIVVDRSRFIGSANVSFTVEEARGFISEVRTEFADATHHVPAFIIGHGAGVIMHCTDDGEPSGTAGRPALAVLQGSGFGDIVVVVTRYYGGRKLGTGGLVRAYSDAVREVLLKLPKAEKVATTTLMLSVEYSLYERMMILIRECNGKLIDEEFAAEVTLSVQLRNEHVESFISQVIDVTRGKGKIVQVEENANTVMPID